MKKNSAYIAFLLFSIFFLSRIVNFHAIKHLIVDDTENHCEYCELLCYQNEENNLLFSLDPEQEHDANDASFPLRKKVETLNMILLPKTLLFNCVFNKPPPSLLLLDF